MPSAVDTLLDQVAALDPDKAAYLRWVRPQLGEDGLRAAAESFLASWESAHSQRNAGPKETLLDLEMGLDPDSPTAEFQAFTDDDHGSLVDEDEGR